MEKLELDFYYGRESEQFTFYRLPKALITDERFKDMSNNAKLLYGLMLHSGNDAAVALAIYCGGTVQGFAELMNDKARQLGMKGTHFENPNGLDSPGHYSTARDLAILASYAMENPIFAKAKQLSK